MKRVLLTGGSGFIGSGVLDYLIKNSDWNFIVTASFRHHGNPLNLKDYVKNKRVEIVTLDLTGNIPDMGRFDYILNLASESHVDRSIEDPVNFIENNIKSTIQVLEYARRFPCRRFIQFSTDEVYGAHEHDEHDILRPTNPYAASKGSQELIAMSYHDTYQIPVIITNSNNIVGRNQDPEKFVPKIIDLIKNDKKVTIHTANGKPGSRHWNPVENVADALMFLLEQDYNRKGETPHYALPGGVELDNLEMAELIAELLGKNLKYKEIDATTLRPTYDETYPETSGKLTDMGWEPPFTLREGLQWIKSM